MTGGEPEDPAPPQPAEQPQPATDALTSAPSSEPQTEQPLQPGEGELSPQQAPGKRVEGLETSPELRARRGKGSSVYERYLNIKQSAVDASGKAAMLEISNSTGARP